ncbi:MAG: ABC transporter ATP-binding protein [Alkalinema sp. RL_2_19]|nr:ABC transporter ATP-binding protein [Alkalinema sp. RL_2_19]
MTIVTVLHELNLAARYSHRIAMLQQGCLSAIGTPAEVLTPESLSQVFKIDATVMDTPVGLQVFALNSLN